MSDQDLIRAFFMLVGCLAALYIVAIVGVWIADYRERQRVERIFAAYRASHGKDTCG